ncbi:MalY/PatB family protein [Actinomyces slackii]|nr:aminotransferase class I/II-fold pyridoxal phosphate-dependent enzyme [Actinomyces slackii]
MTQPAGHPSSPSPDSGLVAAMDALTPEAMRAQGSMKWSAHPGDVIEAWVAEMDLGTAPAVTAALERAVAGGRLGYMPPEVARTARQAMADYQEQAFGWQVPTADVSLLPNVLSALSVIIAHHTPAGSPVIVPTPAYMPFLEIPGRHGRECLEVPAIESRDADGSPHWELDLEAIEAAMAERAGLLVLCSPWNPVGRVLSAEELDAVAELSARYGVAVFADEIHAPLILDPRLSHIPYASRPASDPDLTYTATAASKGWNIPGLGCAQLIASGGARRRWQAEARGAVLSHEASILGALATTAALEEGREWNAQVRAYISANAAALGEALAGIAGIEATLPQGTYLSWLDARSLGRRQTAQFFLEEAGVAMNEGTTFGRHWEGFVRLNLATGRGIVTEAARRITEAVLAARAHSA